MADNDHAARLRALRVSRQLTLDDVARAVEGKIHPAELSRLERGQRRMQIDVLENILDRAFGMTLAAFVAWAPDAANGPQAA